MFGLLRLMVIEIIYVSCFAFFEFKNHPPVGSHGDGPKAPEIPPELVEVKAGNIHIDGA